MTNASSKTETVTVVRTVTRVVTTTAAVAPATANACTGSDLTGTFAVLPGSAAAGNIVYTLRVTNAAQSPCSVSGLPQLQLLDSGGKELPTKTTPEQPGTQTAVNVVLQPGSSATSEARFSPDVQGVGEGNPCEPKASTLRVTAPGGGSLDVKIDPATSVCSHGALQLTNFATAS